MKTSLLQKWTKEETSKLIDLYNIGCSADAICFSLTKKTRSAILGKVFRLRREEKLAHLITRPTDHSKSHRISHKRNLGDRNMGYTDKPTEITPDNIRQLRLKLGMSYRDFAKLVGLDGENSGDTVHKWEIGKLTPANSASTYIRTIMGR